MNLIRIIGNMPLRLYLSFILIAFTPCLVYSQSQDSKSCKFQIGLAAGSHLTKLHVKQQYAGAGQMTSNLDSKALLSYHIGIPLKVTHNRIVLYGGLIFINDKAQTSIRNDYNVSTVKQSFNFSWVSIPIQFNYIIIQRPQHQFFAGLGINTRRLLSSSNRVSQDFGTITITGDKIDTYDLYDNWNLFAEAIIGADIVIASKIPISIGLSFDQSVNNLSSEIKANGTLVYDYGIVQSEIHMNSILLSLSYYLK